MFLTLSFIICHFSIHFNTKTNYTKLVQNANVYPKLYCMFVRKSSHNPEFEFILNVQTTKRLQYYCFYVEILKNVFYFRV